VSADSVFVVAADLFFALAPDFRIDRLLDVEKCGALAEWPLRMHFPDLDYSIGDETSQDHQAGLNWRHCDLPVEHSHMHIEEAGDELEEPREREPLKPQIFVAEAERVAAEYKDPALAGVAFRPDISDEGEADANHQMQHQHVAEVEIHTHHDQLS